MTAEAIEALTQRIANLEQLNRIQGETVNRLRAEVRNLSQDLAGQRPNAWPSTPMYPSPVMPAPHFWPRIILSACDPVHPGLHKAIQG